MLKFSFVHPKELIEILKISQDVKKDNKSKKNYKLEPNIVKGITEIFGENVPLASDNELSDLKQHLANIFSDLKNKEFPSKEKPYPNEYSLNSKEGLAIYQICKILQPDAIVETGVAYGSSSSHILLALKNNQKGNLFSIDWTFRPWETKEMIGMAIPKILREKWNFIFGKSSDKLKKTLKDLGKIDVFFHDSLHTYRNMMFEFETAWPHIKNGGVLISDDILSNNAFKDFCDSKKGISVTLGDHSWSLGILRKID